ncbi:hypothetical protein Taro_005174, partial [Colocasia esculenta]|nr:hypothetical protein [Colocasia esculenta]
AMDKTSGSGYHARVQVHELRQSVGYNPRVGRLRSESADSESGRPLATRLWGGNTDPPTGQSGLVYQADSGRLRPTQAESGPTQGRDRLGPTQPPDPTLPSLILRGAEVPSFLSAAFLFQKSLVPNAGSLASKKVGRGRRKKRGDAMDASCNGGIGMTVMYPVPPVLVQIC